MHAPPIGLGDRTVPQRDTAGPETVPEARPARIGYVVKRYPRLSETFIVQEIIQMERRGLDLRLFAIMDPQEPLHNPSVEMVRAPVHYLQRDMRRDSPFVLLDHLRLALKSPERYRSAVRHLLHSSGSRASLRAFWQAGRLARLAEREGITHLHAHFAHNPASLARYASQMTGVPFSFTAHAKDLYLTRPASIINKAELATFVTTCTGYNAHYLQSILPPREAAKVHTVYHGVDTERFRPPPRRPRHAVPVLLSVGRLVPKKGHQYLIEAADLLRRRGVAFQLRLYGDGPQREDLQRQIEGCDLENIVQLRGSCTQDELADAYRRADVFVLAPVVTEDGDRDGIPNVLLEAMASGLPVVSTAISGIPEAVDHGVTGHLVSPGESAALADALAMLLQSADLRRRLGHAARESVCRRFAAAENAAVMAGLLRGRSFACVSPTS